MAFGDIRLPIFEETDAFCADPIGADTDVVGKRDVHLRGSSRKGG